MQKFETYSQSRMATWNPLLLQMKVRYHFTMTNSEPSILRNSTTNSISIYIYIYIYHYHHQPPAPIQECHYGAFLKEKERAFKTSLYKRRGLSVVEWCHQHTMVMDDHLLKHVKRYSRPKKLDYKWWEDSDPSHRVWWGS